MMAEFVVSGGGKFRRGCKGDLFIKFVITYILEGCLHLRGF